MYRHVLRDGYTEIADEMRISESNVSVARDVDAGVPNPVHRKVEFARPFFGNARIHPSNVSCRDGICAHAQCHVVVRYGVSPASTQIAVWKRDTQILPPH